MKVITYQFNGNDIELDYSDESLKIAQNEADLGKYEIKDKKDAELYLPTQLDRIEAQVAYTAMLTDSLLEV